MSKLADVQRKLLALHHSGHPKVEMKPSPMIPDEESAPPMLAPQPLPASPPRRRNRLWDEQVVQPKPKVAAPVSPASLPAEYVEELRKSEAVAPAALPMKKLRKAPVKASKPVVKALLSHTKSVNQDTTTSFNSLLTGRIATPVLPSVKESRAAIDSQEAKKEVAAEEAEEDKKIGVAPAVPAPVVAPTPKVEVAKEPAAVPSPKQQAADKADSDADEDSGVGTSDSDEEDDKALSKLESQVDDFEQQQHQAMAEAKDVTDSP